MELDFEETKRQAEAGDAFARFNLGVLYERGEGVERSDEEAVRCYALAAEAGIPQAQYNLGNMYAFARGVDHDEERAAHWYRRAAHWYRRAAHWYRRAAEQGLAPAQFNLGTSCERGWGVPQSDEEAAYWYRKAAVRCDGSAAGNLARMIIAGRGGLTPNPALSLGWHLLAAALGDRRSAMLVMAAMRAEDGPPPEMRPLIEAAMRRDPAAWVRAGRIWAEGQGVPQDDSLSAAWMYLASNAEAPDGLYELGLRYAEGRGIDQDAEQALHCFSFAAARGHAGAKERLAKTSN